MLTYTDLKGVTHPVIIKISEKSKSESEIVEELFAIFAKDN